MIRRLLSFLGGHQMAIGADHVIFARDIDVVVAFGTDILTPKRPRIGFAVIVLDDLPGTRERVVGHRDLVNEDILVRLAQIDPLVDNALIVRVQHEPGIVVDARPLEKTRLDVRACQRFRRHRCRPICRSNSRCRSVRSHPESCVHR